MKTYQYYSQIYCSDIQVSYNQYGILTNVQVLNSHEIHQVHAAAEQLKNYLKEVDFVAAAMANKLKYFEVDRKVSFADFWDKYKQKDCGRTKAEESWNKLSKINQVMAFDFIPAFEGILKMSNTPKPYATTYLNQKRWIR